MADALTDVRNLLDRYHAAVNYRRPQLFREVFTEDATWELGPPIDVRFTSLGVIVPVLTASIERQVFLVQSSSALLQESDDGQSMRVKSTMVEFGREREDAPPWMATVIFDELIVATADGLRIQHRRGQMVQQSTHVSD